MKKTGKQIAAACLAALLTLSGCAGNGGQTTAEPESTPEATQAASAEAPTEAEPATTQAQTEGAGAAMTDGTYEAQARGFHLLEPVSVTVEIAESRIAAITIGENAETNGMPQMVEKDMIPRILESQSLAVDTITGATATSAAVRAAVGDCCEQAGADLSQLRAEPAKSEQTEEYTVDVVVVGMGGSGTAAALSAAESGATVMALDKAGKWAGTSAITSGPMTVNAPSQVEAEYAEWSDPITKETRVKKAGEPLVDGDALYEDWIAYTTVDGEQHAKT